MLIDAAVVNKPQYLKERVWKQADNELESHILDIISSENLIVLSGSGTSLGPAMQAAGSPSMGALLDKAKELAEYEPTQELYGKEPDDIEKFLSWCLLYMQLGLENHGVVGAFYRKAENLIRDMCDYVTPETILDAHETFLSKIVRRTRDMPRLQLFTTNYDRAFEEAAARLAIQPLDGFDFSSKPRFNGKHFDLDIVRREEGRKEPEFLEDVFKLLKVHGSVDWDESDGYVYKTEKPTDPAMIYPQAGKYEASYDSPFLDLMSRFQRALRQKNLGILVLGYGFRDRHLNNPLLMALKENRNLKIAVVDIGFDFGDVEMEEPGDDLPIPDDELVVEDVVVAEEDIEPAAPEPGDDAPAASEPGVDAPGEPEDAVNPQDDKQAAHKELRRLVESNSRIGVLVKASFADFADFMPQYLTETERERFDRASKESQRK